MITAKQDGRMTVANAAAYIGLSQSTLNSWRSKTNRTGKHHGPVFTKLGGKIFYFKEDIDEWIQARRSF